MSGRLEAWLEGHHAGQFVFGDGPPRFEYDAEAPATPLSLSLPRDGRATKLAPANFLENLLPENERTRQRMASAYSARSASAFDLLSAAGGDVAGGLVLLPEGGSPSVGAAELSPALHRDIAERAAAIKRDSSETVPRSGSARFSLAGAQGKFALAWVERDWYWPNASVPSTHIVKPGSPEHRNIEAAEAATIELAALAGVRAPQAEVLRFGDQTSYVIERFDREAGTGALSRRLHAEDIAQSLGLPPDRKYEVSVAQVMARLKPVDHNGTLRRSFLAQLAFTVLVGDSDAHAKNYSLLLRPSGIVLSPMYDVLPMFLYPDVDQKLAMPIGGARFAREVTSRHWASLARTVGMDPDEVVGVVRRVAERVAEHNDEVWSGVDADQAAEARVYVARNIERAL
ncbi:HipA domain-containing protein [Herbiconiux sp. KACC 21604]|uniref:HipA domain-containing protein n=1 Tax=unclassified Herbiconiux TaxID=2618217 RepID=UPI00149218DD|nr:HipA domain-containing protein [Herbiconiux sp. SALV-R1]QJU52548.1 type II toxin-antitoxin system HipA family toxin [Herbiconiux sp. SALV-R1]WPO87424.1 HipA domain-containing protein [Herbiconiux sp. KACC 21604]